MQPGFQLHSTKQRNSEHTAFSSGLIALEQSVQLDALMRDKAGQVLDPKLSRAAAQVAAQHTATAILITVSL